MIKFTLQIEDKLHEKIKFEAEKNKRSIGAQYRVILEEKYNE